MDENRTSIWSVYPFNTHAAPSNSGLVSTLDVALLLLFNFDGIGIWVAGMASGSLFRPSGKLRDERFSSLLYLFVWHEMEENPNKDRSTGATLLLPMLLIRTLVVLANGAVWLMGSSPIRIRFAFKLSFSQADARICSACTEVRCAGVGRVAFVSQPSRVFLFRRHDFK